MRREEVEKQWTKFYNDSSFKGAAGTPLNVILYHNQISPKDKQLKFCKDTIIVLTTVIYMKKDFYLLDKVNDVINYLNAAGLVQFWHEEFLKTSHFNDQSDNQALNKRDVEGAFTILYSGLFISTLWFFCEKIIRYFKTP